MRATWVPQTLIGSVYPSVVELLAADLPRGTVVVSGLGTAWQLAHHWSAATDTLVRLDAKFDTDFRVVHVPLSSGSGN